MKDDTNKYKPDVAKVLRDMEPAKVLARQQNALAKFYAGPEGTEAEPAEARVIAPSPWAKDGATEVDKAALPSATTPKTDERATTKATAVPAWRSWRVVAACAAFGAMALLAAVLVQMGRAPRVQADATAVQMAASASERAGGPGVMMTAAAPSAAATTAPSATATATASGTPTATRALKPPSKALGEGGDPYDAAAPPPPKPPESAIPAPPPPPAVTSAPLAPTPTAATPFLVRKREP